MFDLKLFLGFAVDELFQLELKNANPYLISLLIGKPDYLEEISFQKKTYLGKFLSVFPSLEQLDTMEKHLLSLLLKLTPRYPFSKNPPVILTLTPSGAYNA